MPDRENVIKGLEILMNGCEYIHCDDCCFYISTKPTRCGLREEQIQEEALALLKEQEAVVRCNDCKHRGDRHKCIVAFVAEKQEMPYFFYDNRGEWFCADGERKDE